MFESIASKAKAWRPAADVLTKVRAVPTDFVQLDRATKVGGWPIERICTVHGPSNHGKTLLCHGLGLSFLRRQHFYAFIDAEYTTPLSWLTGLMGRYATHPGFLAQRPESFEQTVDAVRQFVDLIGEGRSKGTVGEDTSALIVLDSLRKLVPENLLKSILRHGASGDKGSVDGMRGRGGMYKAALQSQWLDELVPLIAKAGVGFVILTREADDPLADTNDFKFDNAWKVTGSKAAVYDASLVARVTRTFVHDGDIVTGEKHRVRIWKTKIGDKEDDVIDAHFYTNNGVNGAPVGFDPARDLFELALEHGIIEQNGAWYAFDGERLGQGASKAMSLLRASPEIAGAIEQKARLAFGSAGR